MASVGTYLNFPGNAEEAFNFYKGLFGGEFASEGGGEAIMRFGAAPPQEGAPQLSEAEQNMVMHVCLPILGGHALMGSDVPGSTGNKVIAGTNSYICLSLDSRAETKRLFDALSEGGKAEMELQDTFWGSYFGSCADKYGVQWMFDCVAK
jgi:PhnB protein